MTPNNLNKTKYRVKHYIEQANIRFTEIFAVAKFAIALIVIVNKIKLTSLIEIKKFLPVIVGLAVQFSVSGITGMSQWTATYTATKTMFMPGKLSDPH